MSAELEVKFDRIEETPHIFPDERGKIQITVTNRGDSSVSQASVNLYASTDTELELDNLNTNGDRIPRTNINALKGTDELLGTLDGINLAASQSRTLTINFKSNDFHTSSVVAPGAYNLLALVDPLDKIAEKYENNNQAIQFVSNEGTDAILDWNSVFLNAVQTDGKVDRYKRTALTNTRVPGVAPPKETRDGAIMHKAMYEAVKAVNSNSNDAPLGASAEAAAVGAAYQVLSKLYPEKLKTFDEQQKYSLEEIQEDPSAEKLGFDYGKLIGDRIIADRAKDLSNKAQTNYTPGNNPGDYPETNDIGISVSALFPDWGKVTPFVLDDVARFRPDGPPKYGSDEYVREVEQIRHLGGLRETDLSYINRTQEQTEIAQFWAYDRQDTFRPAGQWNEIAQQVALERGNSLEDNALLFAQLNVAMADAGIVAWDTKYIFNQQRPIHNIKIEDKDWRPLLPTPPFPDYISGHSAFGGAAARVLENFFGEDIELEIHSQELPGVTRTFTSFGNISSFEQAAIENANSRLYGGVHLDSSNVDGLTTGQKVADYVLDHFL
jgi:CARDB